MRQLRHLYNRATCIPSAPCPQIGNYSFGSVHEAKVREPVYAKQYLDETHYRESVAAARGLAVESASHILAVLRLAGAILIPC
jgi:hypothetical protein